MYKNEFIKKTIEGLGIDGSDPRLGIRVFKLIIQNLK